MQGLSTSDAISDYNSDNDSKVILQDEHNVAIFDWDNTLFCTEYLDLFKIDYKKLFQEQMSIDQIANFLGKDLETLQDKILDLFSELLNDHNVKLFIVTNADYKWVQNCLKHLLPELNEFLQEREIKIYSAKKLFSKNLPVEKWKIKCFKKVVLDNFSDKNASIKILSIGDSNEEKIASLALKSLNYYRQINVNFLETFKYPDIDTLVQQFGYIAENFTRILQSKQFLHRILSR